MKRILVAFALLISVPAHAEDAMTKAAGDFYAIIRTSNGGLPDAATRAKLAPLITPSLAHLLDAAARAEDRFMQANKNSPPLIEGDLYSSLFEGPTSFAIGDCSGNDKTAHCTVALAYDDKASKAATRWTDTIFLANAGDGWKVDDIGYGGNWDFGNKGKLSDTLRQVTSFTSE